MSDVVCAVYLRISEDKTGEREKVGFQLDEARGRIAARGWEFREDLVYVDNSVSAYNVNVRRPAYQRLSADYAAGRFNGVVTWELDRFTRQPRELEDWIDAAKGGDLKLFCLNEEMDLTTPDGIFLAGLKVQLARREMMIKSARHKFANASRAREGQPHRGGKAPFGYTAGMRAIVPEEAQALRDAAERVLRGTPLAVIAREWGYSAHGVRAALLHPRNAGLRYYNGERMPKKGTWPAILDEATHLALRAYLGERKGIGAAALRTGRRPTTLLASLAVCGLCGGPVRATANTAGAPRYTCSEKRCFTGPRECVDTYVAWHAVDQLSRKEGLVRSDDDGTAAAELVARKEAIEKQLADLRASWTAVGLTVGEYGEMRASAQQEIAALDERLAAYAAPSLREWFSVDDVAARWGAASIEDRRTVVGDLFKVELFRGRKGKGAAEHYARNLTTLVRLSPRR